MAPEPDAARGHDSAFARNGPTATAPAETPEAMADRLRRLEEQLAALHAHQTALPTYPLPRDAEPAGLSALVPTVSRMMMPAIRQLTRVGSVWDRFPFLTELRLMVKMYVDPKYRLSRIAQFGVPAVLGLMVVDYLFVDYFTFGLRVVTPVVERLLLVVLAVVLYKILAREAGRYADVLVYLSRYDKGRG